MICQKHGHQEAWLIGSNMEQSPGLILLIGKYHILTDFKNATVTWITALIYVSKKKAEQ